MFPYKARQVLILGPVQGMIGVWLSGSLLARPVSHAPVPLARLCARWRSRRHRPLYAVTLCCVL